MPKITQDSIHALKKRIRDQDLIEKHFKERVTLSDEIKKETLRYLGEDKITGSPVLFRRKFKLTYKSAKELYEWTMTQAIPIKNKEIMEEQEIRDILKELGAPDDMVERNMDKIVKRLKDKESLEKTLKLFDHIEQLIISILSHLNIDRETGLRFFINFIANQTSDLSEDFLEMYLNFIKAKWRINKTLDELL